MKAEPAPEPEPEPQQPPERQQAQRSQRQAPPLVWRETEEISSTESTPTSSPPAPQSRPPDARVQLVWKETEDISDGDEEEEELSDEEEDDSDSTGSWSPEAQRGDVQARAAREIDGVVGAELTRAAHCAAAAEGVRDMVEQLLQGQGQGREAELAPAALNNQAAGAVWGAEAASAIADLAGSSAGNER